MRLATQASFRQGICLALAVACAACGTAATVSSLPDATAGHDASTGEAGCMPAGSVPGCPCDLSIPGTVTHVGDIACASGIGPAAVACGKRVEDGGVAFVASDASVWVPVFTCPGKDTCSAVTTLDELTCTDSSSGEISYLAILGAPCFHADEGACLLDKGTVMVCKAGVWTAFTMCSNHSCAQQGDHPGCAPG
jgi:hypothetical protein